MGYGDEILAAGQAQRAYDADPSRPVAVLGADGKPRWHELWAGNPAIATPADTAAGIETHTVINGPNARPYIRYPFTKETGWTFNTDFRCRDHVARLYLTEAELYRGLMAADRYGAYVLIEPHTKHENFRWPLANWAELVRLCPDVIFVQHTHADSQRIPGCYYEPASFRSACGLLTKASAYVRSESGMCHAAAALGIPQVTLFGGCMDASVMGGYAGQVCLVDDDPETPCGRWLPCRHCQAAMTRITVGRVEQALRQVLNHGSTRDVRAGEGPSAGQRRRQQRRHRSQTPAGERHRAQVRGEPSRPRLE